MSTNAGTPQATTKLGGAVEIWVVAPSTLVAVGESVLFLAATAQTEPAWRRDTGHQGPPADPVLRHRGATTSNSDHTTPATEPSAPGPWCGKPQSSKEEK
jgi:hypothetical protein